LRPMGRITPSSRRACDLLARRVQAGTFKTPEVPACRNPVDDGGISIYPNRAGSTLCGPRTGRIEPRLRNSDRSRDTASFLRRGDA